MNLRNRVLTAAAAMGIAMGMPGCASTLPTVNLDVTETEPWQYMDVNQDTDRCLDLVRVGKPTKDNASGRYVVEVELRYATACAAGLPTAFSKLPTALEARITRVVVPLPMYNGEAEARDLPTRGLLTAYLNATGDKYTLTVAEIDPKQSADRKNKGKSIVLREPVSIVRDMQLPSGAYGRNRP